MLLGIDVGTTAVKALAIDDTGRALALGECAYPTCSPHPGWSEQDAEDWWAAVVGATRAALAQVEAPAIAGLAISTQGDTLVPVDAAGRPLGPARTWMDTRTGHLIPGLESRVDAGRWRSIAGAALGPYAAAMTIVWLRAHRPEVYRDAARFALVQDFLTQRLTGEPWLDYPNASRTLLFDITQRAWSGLLVDAVEVEPERLSPVAASGTAVGSLLPAAAEALGLPAGIPVCLGGHDQTCAGVGAGVVRAGSMLLSCGTAWVLLASVDGPDVGEGDGGVQVYCHAAPDRWALLTAHAGGNVLSWCREVLYGGGEVSYEQIGAEAAGSLARESEPLLLLPHFYGGSSSPWLRNARGAVLGLTLGHSREDLALAVMRGVTLEVLRNFELMGRQSRRPEEIRMIGGGAKSDLWAHMIADGTGVPVVRPEVSEAASYGAALLAGVGAGVFASVDEMVQSLPVRDVLEPSPGRQQLYSEMLARFEESITALCPIHQRMAESGRRPDGP